MDTDLRNTKARLTRVAIATVIGGVFTFFTIKAMTSSGPAPNHDPVGSSMVPLLAIFVFVVTTLFAHAILSKRRSSR